MILQYTIVYCWNEGWQTSYIHVHSTVTTCEFIKSYFFAVPDTVSLAAKSLHSFAFLGVLDALNELPRRPWRESVQALASLLVLSVSSAPAAGNLVVSTAEVVIVVFIKVEVIHGERYYPVCAAYPQRQQFYKTLHLYRVQRPQMLFTSYAISLRL